MIVLRRGGCFLKVRCGGSRDVTSPPPLTFWRARRVMWGFAHFRRRLSFFIALTEVYVLLAIRAVSGTRESFYVFLLVHRPLVRTDLSCTEIPLL